MFRRYCFAEFDLLDGGWPSIAHTKHVTGILPLGKSPEPIRQGVIEYLMQAQEANGGAIPLEKPVIEPFRQGEAVRIMLGPFTNLVALVQADEGERVRVLLDMFGRSHGIPMTRESIARC